MQPPLLRQTGCEIDRQRENHRIEEERDDGMKRRQAAHGLAVDDDIRRLRGRSERCRELEEVPIVGVRITRKRQSTVRFR